MFPDLNICSRNINKIVPNNCVIFKKETILGIF